jgi:GNAT superfamily N-acetyltransferase
VEVQVVDDVVEFAGLAAPVLHGDPARNTLMLTLLDAAVRGAGEVVLLLVARGHERVEGVALRTPGRPLLVSAMPARYAAAVASLLREADPDVPGVSGPVETAPLFADAIAAATGVGVRVQTRSRLFELGELTEPTGVPGVALRAGQPEVELLGRWRREFTVETHEGWNEPVSAEEVTRRLLSLGAGEFVWTVDGEPVSLASARPVVAGMSRIGPVYTPPEHRGRGYAAAVTAVASRWALDAGAERVVLFTDLANPTSNALYPRIGFRPVADVVDLAVVHDRPG